MTRTKSAILAVWVTTMDPFGPAWLRAIIGLVGLAAAAYVVWFLWSDTEPRETYTRKVEARKVRVER